MALRLGCTRSGNTCPEGVGGCPATATGRTVPSGFSVDEWRFALY